HRPVLHAGTQHDATARSLRTVRRVRDAWHRPDARLPAGLDSGSGVEGWPAQILVLVAQRRADDDVRFESLARGLDADLGLGRSWLLVRPQPGVHADGHHAVAPLDASTGRHAVLPGSRGPGLVRGRAEDGPLVPQGGSAMTSGDLDTSAPIGSSIIPKPWRCLRSGVSTTPAVASRWRRRVGNGPEPQNGPGKAASMP